jgi:hypothetical protein
MAYARVPDPTPLEILQLTQQIQEGWSEDEQLAAEYGIRETGLGGKGNYCLPDLREETRDNRHESQVKGWQGRMRRPVI